MNKINIFIVILFLISATTIHAQVKNKPSSIIKTSASMKTYYDRPQLETMQKGELIGLYLERARLLINTLPYIALANKPGLTMTDIGIPDTSDNRKLLETEHESSSTFLISTSDFLSQMLPYSDKSSLITSILFYENVLRNLHVMNE